VGRRKNSQVGKARIVEEWRQLSKGQGGEPEKELAVQVGAQREGRTSQKTKRRTGNGCC